MHVWGEPLTIRAINKAIEHRLEQWVHASARADADMHMLHKRLITLRAVSGLTVLAVLPGLMAALLGLSLSGIVIVASLASTMLAALILSRTGSLVGAQLSASFSYCAATVALAMMTGGPNSPLLILLVFLPFEAQISRRHSAAIGAGLMGLLAVVGVWIASSETTPSNAPSPEALLTTGVVAVSLIFSTLTTLMVMGQRSVLSQQRRETLARSRLMLESVGDMVAWFDASGRLAYINQAAESILRTEPKKLLDRGLFEHVHVADRPLFLKAIDDAAHGGEAHLVHFRVLPSAGMAKATETDLAAMRWIEMRVKRVAAAGGSLQEVAVVAVMRDETEQRQIELEREQARAEAQRASELKGRFLATVSHELRTPLNAIIGFSEMLATDGLVKPGSPQQQDYARIIQTSGMHLLEVVNALLDISKLESGAMTIERDTLDLARLVGECCDLMAMRCTEKNVTLEKVMAGDLPQVMADRRALKQVVINLLSNALKFTPEGGRVTVALVRDKNEIDISISDTGIGIAEADLPQLGLPFFQAKSAYDRSHEGTGLGLSVVRGLVGLHGGSMSIESAPGEGTRVCIRLPIEPGDLVTGDTARIVTFAKKPRRQLGLDTASRLSA
jgi:two-component system, cell cycle sensor histidine kinase DivJ